MTTPLFRHEVIEAKRDRLTGVVVAAVPPRSGTYAVILALACAGFLLIAIFGQFSSRTHVSGIVTYDRGFARVYPPQTAEIRAIHVREGQVVAVGTPLVTISLTQGQDANGVGVSGQLTELARQDQQLLRQQQLAQTLGIGETGSLEQQRAGLAAIIASLERQQALARDQVEAAQVEAARATRLARAGAGPRQQADSARAAVTARRAEVEALEERILGQRRELGTISAQLAQRRVATQQTLSQVAAQRANLAAQRATVIRQDRLVLTAPVAGRVTDLVNQIGQRTRPDVSLVTVIPQGSVLEAQLYTPTRAAGFVRPGDEVRLLFDAFPFQKFGAGIGRVIDISGVPADPSSLDPGLKIDQPVFRIRVRLDRGRGAGAQPLRPGMTLAANLVLERRRMWEVLLDPLLRAARS
ncbi:HlyD family efflux transporter periplasmic adaptor subunit [Sphingomonas sp.]|uniref:HlyD family secretion protein n=1 Tax=Sphingomonas sp. TaxID=28214 RepID=UPI0025904809|nr:HlyD family efflux transporter periplasmic adaptor subunit [Sphingomonas sp.]